MLKRYGLVLFHRIAKANYRGAVVWVTFSPYAVLMVSLGLLNAVVFMLPMSMRM